MLPNRLIGWLSNAAPATPPPSALQTAGHAAGDAFPMPEFNWLLRKLTYWIDGLQDDGSGTPSGQLNLNQLAGTYVQTRLYSNWRVVETWSRGGVNLAQPTYAQPTWDFDPGSETAPLPGYPRQCLPQGNGASPGFPFLVQSPRLPFGAQQIVSVTVRVKPTTSSSLGTPRPIAPGTAPPVGSASIPPRVTVLCVDQDGNQVWVATAGDNAAGTMTVAQYEAAHSITVPVGQPINPATQQMFVLVQGEDNGLGTGFVPGLEVKAAAVTYQFNLMNDVVTGAPL